MNKLTDQQLNRQIAAHFSQAASRRCPDRMQAKLYQKLGIANNKSRFRTPFLTPIMTLSIVFAIGSTILWQQHQLQQRQQAEQEMKIAMHYMNKVSGKTLLKANKHGIKPAVIVPIYKTMAKNQ